MGNKKDIGYSRFVETGEGLIFFTAICSGCKFKKVNADYSGSYCEKNVKEFSEYNWERVENGHCPQYSARPDYKPSPAP